MDIAAGDLVKATAGRESGKLFYVCGVQKDCLLLADGKSRKIEAPKRKNIKHVQLVAAQRDPIAQKLRSNEKITNSELRKAIADHLGENGNQDQEGDSTWQNPI